MKNKILVYIVVLHVVLFPSFKAWSALPALALPARIGLQYAFSSSAMKVVSRGVAANSPYFVAPAKVANNAVLNWIKSAGASAPNTWIANALAALGFAIVGSNIQYSGELAPEQGYMFYVRVSSWRYSAYGSSVDGALREAFRLNGQNFEVVQEYAVDGNVINLINTSGWKYTAELLRVECGSSGAGVASCDPDYNPPESDKSVPLSVFGNSFMNYVSAQPAEEQRNYFLDSNNAFPQELQAAVSDIAEPNTMPDGNPVPNQGHHLWFYADWIARGLAQSSDANSSYYVPPASQANADYLANTVADGQKTITGSNANGSELPDTDKPTTPNPDGVQKVEVTNIEQPLTEAQLNASYQAGADGLSAAESGVSDWSDDYYQQSQDTLNNILDNSVPDSWFTDISPHLPQSGGSCVGWISDFSISTPIGSFSKSFDFSAHCPFYDEYLRPIAEYGLWVSTFIYIYFIGVRALRQAN
ncbi:hypothetical protein [Acinetobacter venetianus]|uniref:hypothetical protein n=1 Tax=Acinetobacter venetianus TaxID=52133 RepID=UPI003A8DF9F4